MKPETRLIPAVGFTVIFLLAAITLSVVILLDREGEKSNCHSHAEGRIPGEVSEEDCVLLDGEWTYFENTLTGEPEYSRGEAVVLPHQWSGTGFGTYALTLKGLDPEREYALFLQDNASAYTLLIDRRQVAQNGVPGRNRREEIFYWEPQIITFTPAGTEAELILQVSNFHSFPGGLLRPPTLGSPDPLYRARMKTALIQSVLIGGLLLSAFVNLSLFLLNRDDKSVFYLGCFSLFVSYRLFITGERIITLWLDNLNWIILYRSLFLSSTAIIVFFVLLLNSVFRLNRTFIRTVLSTSAVFLFFSLITPVELLHLADYFFLGFSLLTLTYLMVYLIIGCFRREPGAFYPLIGLLFIISAVIIDSTLPPTTSTIPVGLFIFTLFQSLLVAKQHSTLREDNSRLSHIASFDAMTGLMKKESLIDHMNRAIEEESEGLSHGVIFIDIDDFKRINDTYGHDWGDELLTTLADRLKSSLRQSDRAGRYGGDEFFVWLHNTSPRITRDVAERLLAKLAKSVKLNGDEVSVSISIGGAFYPREGTDIQGLISLSDKRMYAAKKQGKNRAVLTGGPDE